jgi:hypothetical protein
MTKIFLRSILLLSVVTTALSLFQHGIVSRDQHEIEDAVTNIVPTIKVAADALNVFHPGSELPELMVKKNPTNVIFDFALNIVP